MAFLEGDDFIPEPPAHPYSSFHVVLFGINSLSLQLLQVGHFLYQHFVLGLESILLVLYLGYGVKGVVEQFCSQHWQLLPSCLSNSCSFELLPCSGQICSHSGDCLLHLKAIKWLLLLLYPLDCGQFFLVLLLNPLNLFSFSFSPDFVQVFQKLSNQFRREIISVLYSEIICQCARFAWNPVKFWLLCQVQAVMPAMQFGDSTS